MLPKPPRWILALALLISALVGLSALYGVFLAIVSQQWFSLAFEVVLLVSAVFGALLGLGRFREGPGIGLLCVAGAVLTCTVLSWMGGQNSLGALRHDPMSLGRLAASGGLGGLAALVVLLRNPARSFRSAAVGLVLGALGLLVATLAMLPPVRAFLASQSFAAYILGAIGIVFGGLLFVALVSVGTHLVIRAFEFGNAPDAPVTDGAPTLADKPAS